MASHLRIFSSIGEVHTVIMPARIFNSRGILFEDGDGSLFSFLDLGLVTHGGLMDAHINVLARVYFLHHVMHLLLSSYCICSSWIEF